ncbi:MAG TPA: hypothetical protein PLM98_15375, partial [Thiolinea sp.]|nr:hypothetical protein [Thiolinea sp.]
TQIGSFNRCYGELKTGSKVVTNNDDALYVSLMTTAYPAVSPEATAKPIMIQRKWYKLTGEVLNPEDMKVGDLVLTRLTIESAEPIPHALVVDLLPSGVELEQGDLQANEVLQALKLDDMAVSVAETMAYSGSIHESFWPDRYVANLELKAKADRTLFYLARVRSPAIAFIPQAYVVDLDQPYIQGLSTAKGVLHTMH